MASKKASPSRKLVKRVVAKKKPHYFSAFQLLYKQLVEVPTVTSINMWARFIHLEVSGGIVLVAAAVLAIIVANSSFAEGYDHFLHLPVTIGVGGVGLEKSLQHFVNDGLMAIFFLLVGMEIKREFIEGELSERKHAVLPLIAAFSGMAVPALIYVFFNLNSPEYLGGWAIPAATDIAFAIGIMALVGSRVPVGMKVLLVAIAVIDDLGAILVIALFYTSQLSTIALVGAAILIFALSVCNRLGVTSRVPYLLLGLVLWIFVLKSGVHATLAGVCTAMAIPLRTKNRHGESPLVSLEADLAPWVTFLVLPIFGYTNAGFSFAGLSIGDFFHPVAIGIGVGLLLGKQIGIFSSIWLVVRSGIGVLPRGTDWAHIYAMSILCGIGFTISLFIGELAFPGDSLSREVRIGVFGGSILAAVIGYVLMVFLPVHSEVKKTPKATKRKLVIRKVRG